MKEKDKEFIEYMGGIAVAVRYIYWVIPIVLVPSAFVIYFTEGRNELQFVSIIAFAIVLTWILRALMRYSIRTYSRALEQPGKEKQR